MNGTATLPCLANMTEDDYPLTRRRALLGSASIASGGVAGCLGDGDGSSSGDSSPLSDEERMELARKWEDLADDELDVVDWRFSSIQFIPEYADNSSPEDDIPLLIDTFAEIIEDGFDMQSMPTAVDEDGSIEYMTFIAVDNFNDYLNGEISREQLAELVADTVHADGPYS